MKSQNLQSYRSKTRTGAHVIPTPASLMPAFQGVHLLNTDEITLNDF